MEERGVLGVRGGPYEGSSVVRMFLESCSRRTLLYREWKSQKLSCGK